MANHDNQLRMELVLPVVIRTARQSDLRKLECFGQFTHLRTIFERSFQEQANGNRIMLIADLNGYPIGRLFIQFRSSNSTFSDGHTRAYLYSFFVLDMFRRQGIGTRFMRIAESILLRRQFQYATIAVAKDNPQAMQLYERLGYCVFDESDGKWQYHDHLGTLQTVYEPSWLLEKKLVSSH